MKIGLIADTHDNMPAIMKAVNYFNETGVDLVLHAGDLIAPFTAKPFKHLKADFIAVFGNNDGERAGLSKAFEGKIFRGPHLVTFHNKKILLMHEPDQLDALAISGHFDAIVYGHTHESRKKEGRCLVINPGECGGWLNGKRTIGLWDLDANEVQIIPI